MIADPMNDSEGDMAARLAELGCTVCPADAILGNPGGFDALIQAVVALPPGGFLSPEQVKAVLDSVKKTN